VRNQAEVEAIDFLLAHAGPIMMATVARIRDERHARIVLASTVCDLAVSRVQLLQNVAALARVSRSATAFGFAVGALPTRMHATAPLLLRLLDLAALAADIAALVLHARLEIAGLRGLLLLLRWAERRAPLELRRLTPFEGGPLGALRFCRYGDLTVCSWSRRVSPMISARFTYDLGEVCL